MLLQSSSQPSYTRMHTQLQTNLHCTTILCYFVMKSSFLIVSLGLNQNTATASYLSSWQACPCSPVTPGACVRTQNTSEAEMLIFALKVTLCHDMKPLIVIFML